MYGINYYRDGAWIGYLRCIAFEMDAREMAETWIGEAISRHGYELVERGLIFESRMRG